VVVRNRTNARRNVGHPTISYRVAELLRFKAKARPELPTPNRAYKAIQVTNIHENGPQHNVAWTILPALLIPEHGTSLHTIAATGGVKVLASVNMRPGDGLTRGARRTAVKAHDICQVVVHADLCRPDRKLPRAADFHAPTLLWALEKTEQIALWCERGTMHLAEVATWIVNAAHAGSSFQTIINATPEHAAHWLAYTHRWKGEHAKVRVFGQGVQQS
jgi:hypothetical protein